MANVKVSLEGAAAMKRKLERASTETPKEARRCAVGYATEELLPRVQARTPVDKGDLLKSERVRVMVSPKKQEIRVGVVAGGPEAPHARIVHEIHKTKAKFLESVILEAVPTAGAAIAARLDLAKMVGA